MRKSGWDPCDQWEYAEAYFSNFKMHKESTLLNNAFIPL